MRMQGLLLAVSVLAGCTKASEEQLPVVTAEAPGVAPKRAPPPPAPPPPAKAQVQIELTSVTLADDCGGTAPHTAPVREAKRKAKSVVKADSARSGARARRRCEQTSMQLAITAAGASRIQVKSVELFGDDGKSLGRLAPSKPTRWSVDDGMYQMWDETLPAGATANVSYVLAQPEWARIGNRWNRTFTLKTVISIGGVDRAAQKEVTLSAPTSLPPNVKT